MIWNFVDKVHLATMLHVHVALISSTILDPVIVFLSYFRSLRCREQQSFFLHLTSLFSLLYFFFLFFLVTHTHTLNLSSTRFEPSTFPKGSEGYTATPSGIGLHLTSLCWNLKLYQSFRCLSMRRFLKECISIYWWFNHIFLIIIL